jgi:hypothetical protein
MKVTDPEVSHIQHLNWAAAFCKLNVAEESKKPGRREAIALKLFEFISDSNKQKEGAANDGRTVLNVPGSVQRFLGLMTEYRLTEIQKALKGDLHELAVNDFFSVKLPTTTTSGDPLAARISWGAFNPASRVFRQIDFPADPQIQARIALGLHVEQSGLTIERIRRCPRCENVFVMERKPLENRENHYCGAPCARAAAMKAYNERQGNKAKPTKKSRRKK